MRISDWSSDVCSSDLAVGRTAGTRRSLPGRESGHRHAAQHPRSAAQANAARVPASRLARAFWSQRLFAARHRSKTVRTRMNTVAASEEPTAEPAAAGPRELCEAVEIECPTPPPRMYKHPVSVR